jgi:hypothetical protein
MSDYKQKYLKYKQKYLAYKNLIGGNKFNIFLLKKNGELVSQASVEKTDIYNVTLNPLPGVIRHMEEYFKELYNLMLSYNESKYDHDGIIKTKTHEYRGYDGKREFVRGIIFDNVHMRKGDYYYVIQQSDRGVRFLLYAANEVHHSSDAFGTDMRKPEPQNQKHKMQQILESLKPHQLQEINIPNLSQYIRDDSLYFL